MPKKPINPASTSKPVEITFKALAVPQSGSVVVLTDEKAEMSGAASAIDSSGLLKRAFKVAKFTGKARSSVDIIAPAGSDLDRIVAVGIGEREKMEEFHWLRLGGAIAGKAGSEAITLIASAAPELSAQEVAWLAEGILLRAYRFDRYKTSHKDDDGPSKNLAQVTIMVENPAPARKLFKRAKAVSGGVALARDVVNEPANILGPVEFANAAEKLKDLGVDVEILGEKQIAKLKMGAFLGVSQGSSRPPRIAIMRWNGGKSKDTPVAFIGKGVVFDTGGISIKPSAGMEDMKGDMGGAAAVIGLMHAVAARKAKANVIGMIGLVENMPDGNAQRPGDIVTSMSGKTIEVLNTDAEGRLILADLLTLCQKRFKPEFIIDLATLTGAIVVALGNHHAGLFSNDDELAERLGKAGVHTGERVWRMPLAEEYDKMIDSKNADVKNIGGKWAGAVTAAQFLKRFVDDVKWAHLDIAGTAMGSPLSDVNQSWGSGFGVRLLDRLIADHYEDPAPKSDS